jgi:tripartite-type tricarboxylate transporter receptor subunit TctC
MLMRRILARATLASAAVFLLTGAGALAQSWPTHSVNVVVPFTASTTSDVVARALVDDLARNLGQPFVIDNRGGAGGNIGAGIVAKAKPDGYTLLLATTGPAATNKLMYKDLPFDSQRDFAPIVLIGKSPVIIVARPDLPAKSLKQLIDYAKANPDKLTAGYPGNGTLGHVTGELLQQRAQIRFSHTQYRGSAAIMTDLLGGHIDIGMDSMAAYVPNVKEGKLKALAIGAATRWPGLPDVPTAAESGLAGFEASVWYALLAPAKTPADIIAKLNAATNAFIGSPQAKEMFGGLGIVAAGGSPDDLKAFIAAEVEKWAPIVRAANITF